MRVLWFTNSPSLAAQKVNITINTQGWVASLEQKLAEADVVELGIAFPVSKRTDSFSNGNTTYFPFLKKTVNGKIKELAHRWKHLPESVPQSQLLEIVDEFKPDVIHIFGTEHEYGLITPHVRIPVIIQIQGVISQVIRHWYSTIDRFDVLKYGSWRGLILGYGLWHHYYTFSNRAKREKIIYGLCSNYIGRTEWDKNIVRMMSKNGNYFHCDEILRSDFYNTIWQQPTSDPFVIFSTLGPFIYKGLETILETAILMKKRVKLNFLWRIAGVEGNEEIIMIIEKKYKQTFSSKNITFLGSINSRSLLNNLLQSSVYVHPSHIENSPNSICEAMLLGMPVIACNTGGIASLINHRVNGVLVQDGDAESIASVLKELYDNKQLASSLGIAGRILALERHNPEKIVKALTGHYNSVVALHENIQ
jgi:glycosyltransferase involved in cell wall biosynthesis